MMVTGTLDDGTAYQVQVTGQAAQPIIGSRRVRAMVEQYSGQPVLLSPLGPRRDLDPTDADAVLALLRQHSAVVEFRP